jgi:hypothetical protein
MLKLGHRLILSSDVVRAPKLAISSDILRSGLVAGYKPCECRKGRQEPKGCEPAAMKLLARPQGLTALAPHFRPVVAHRSYATQNNLGTTSQSAYSRRKPVTPFNDDGQVPWHELSAGEKTARATQQTFNFGLIIAGIVMTVRILCPCVYLFH